MEGVEGVRGAEGVEGVRGAEGVDGVEGVEGKKLYDCFYLVMTLSLVTGINKITVIDFIQKLEF